MRIIPNSSILCAQTAAQTTKEMDDVKLAVHCTQSDKFLI